MIRRRGFLMGCGGCVAAPALAQVALLASFERGTPGKAGQAVVPTSSAEGTQDVRLRIAGWDREADSRGAWVRINASWRADWR